MMKKTFLIFCIAFSYIQLFAQKLPDVQTAALTPPANIRVDGKAADWKDTFAAENKRTEIFYSLANDDKNLYLVIKSTNTASANKIMAGGVTFVVNTEGKKKDKDAISLTYPLVPRGNRNPGGGNRQGFGGGQGQNRQGGGNFQNRTQQTQTQRDSANLVRNKAALTSVKEIKIAGIKAIPDSLISIYNEYGIKAVAAFDAQGALVYELALPLQFLEIDANSGKEFAYQVRINGLNFGGNVMVMGRPGGGGGNFGGGNFGGGNFQDMMSPTDFWGKYTLIKK